LESEQYDIMAIAEDHHWWYLALRDAIEQCLRHPSFSLPNRPSILDAGCGTGANLRHLDELLKPKRLVGFDISEQALRHATRKVPKAELYVSDLCNPDVRGGSFDLIVSCDVLYVTGANRAELGLKRLCDALTLGGIFIWNLPAYNWMASYHDQVVHTRERFTRKTLESLCINLGLECLRISYRMHPLLPLILAKRWTTTFLNHHPNHSDLRQPKPWINRLLVRTLQLENRFIANGISFPWGSSVFAICKKRPIR
jgi:SAM-dependent methyltransferase